MRLTTGGGFLVMKRVSLMIDGGHLRVKVQQAGKTYDNDYIEGVALACVGSDEDLFRIFYYDCSPFTGEVTSRCPVRSSRIPSFLKTCGKSIAYAVKEFRSTN